MPKPPVEIPGIFDLKALMGDALKRTIQNPGISGYTPQEHQLPFHQSKSIGRLMLGGNRCLAKNTLIQMDSGSAKAVQDVRTGDYVKDVSSGPLYVLYTFTNGMRRCRRYYIKENDRIKTVECTPDHNFLSADGRLLSISTFQRKGFELSPNGGIVFFSEDIGAVETYDICVDSPFEVFQLENGLICHNSGKTVAGATEMIWQMTGLHPYNQRFKPPLKCRAIGVDFDDGIDKIIKPEIARWMPPSYLIDGSWDKSYSRGTRTLTLTNGSTLEFMSYDQDVDKFAGTSRHHCWFDEEAPEAIFNENMLRLLDTGGTWWMTMTPLIDMSWTYDRVVEPALKWQREHRNEENANVSMFRVSSLDNAFINKATLEVLLEGMEDEEKSARIEGKYFTYTGAIYAPYLSPSNFIPPIHNSAEWPKFYREWGHFAMCDPGFSGGTGWLVGCYNEEGKIIIYYEYFASKKTVEENAIAIKSIISDLRLETRLDYMVMDPAGWQKQGNRGESYAAVYAQHGLYFGQANHDLTGLQRVMSRFQKRQLLITENCEKLRWELGRYRWAKWDTSKSKAKNNPKEKPLEKDNHLVDALRYGVVSRPALVGEPTMSPGNILNLPMPSTGYDEELRMGDEYPVFEDFDENLGTDW